MNPVRTVAPTARAISTEDVRSRLRVSHTDEDVDIENMIAEAVSALDGYRGILGRPIMPQTWRETYTAWGTLRLALPDVTSVTVTYLDAAGDPQTLADTDLEQDHLGFFVEADGPTDATDIAATYACQAPADILPSIRRAICLHVQMSFDNRDASNFDQINRAFQAQVSHIRWMGV